MRFVRKLTGLVAVGTLVMFCACAPRAVKLAGERGKALFSEAENLYNQGLYNSARNLYEDYIDRFTDGENVPAALLRLGDIYFVRGEYNDARLQFSHLIERFPESGFAEDARINVLLSWFNEQEYRRVIDYADTIKDDQVSDDCVARKYAAVSDAYLAMGESGDAAYVLISGLRKVGAEAQKEMLVKLSRISDKIGWQALQNLLASVKDPGFRGYLSCQIAGRYMQTEEYDQAVKVLSDYIAAYPDNPYAAKASEMIKQIDKAAVYDFYANGCLLPLTGEYRLFGERALNGIQLAFQDFVSLHSLQGTAPPIKLIVGDTGSNPDKAVLAVKKLAEKKVAAIIGPLGPFEASIREAQNNHIPIMTLSQEEGIPEIGKYVFRNFLTPQMQVDALVDYACRTLGLRKFAVLYPDEEYGRVFANKFWDDILKYGGEMVGFESYDPHETDFAEPIKKLVGLYYTLPESLQEAREKRLIELGLKPVDGYSEEIVGPQLPENMDEEAHETKDQKQNSDEDEEEEKALVDFDALFIPDGPSNAGLIIPQLAYYDIVNTRLLGTNLWYSQDLIDTAGWYAQGSVLPAGFWDNEDNGTGKSFSVRYERFYNDKPGFVSAIAYDSAAILMNIISDTNLHYRHSIIDRLTALKDYPGVTGITAFYPNGEVHKSITLLKIKSRRFVKIDNAVAGSGTGR